jgi:Type III restriction enzyme, res subunit/Helicase conserved C-terminal domain
MISVSTAKQLLDFGVRIGQGQRAEEQLEGAVALHNILCNHRVAYLADEVGMGKTYVALGVLALFRHFQPDFRVLVLTPRQNIQEKWMKEMRNFVAHNVKFPDFRVRTVDGQSVRDLVSCENLVDLVQAVTANPDRDFFARMTSFSLAAGGDEIVDPEAARDLRDKLRRHLPWLSGEIFGLRDKQGFKDNVARAVCCALPEFDLVIVDEGHNLKHGFGKNVSARNRVLALAFGRPSEKGDPRLFPRYGPKARRVLFLSATPVEETYAQLYHQLDVFGVSGGFEDLKRNDVEEARKKEVVAQFLVRRVTVIPINGHPHTKNLYRREWRQGGVETHDNPISVQDDRKRLAVALVQKKVSEILGHEKFGSSFQIGMLASFESFLETAKVKHNEEDTGNFDDTDQTDKSPLRELEREGIDVVDVNRLARSYRESFNGEELPHPKMDAVVTRLSKAWTTGEKALVFVRRVASVKELKRKLDRLYDQWLLERLRRELPSEVMPQFERVVDRYLEVRKTAAASESSGISQEAAEDSEDRGGSDTFFAWFFRGEGPRGVISGANVQQRFTQRGTAYSTFFEDNYVADVLGCDPADVTSRLAVVLGMAETSMREYLRLQARKFLRRVKKHPRADRFEAVQAAAVERLAEIPGPHQELARVVWHTRFERCAPVQHADEAPDIGGWLDLRTFFTELRRHPELQKQLWPNPEKGDLRLRFRERQLRAQLLSATARLGHAFIDLYTMTIGRLRSLDLRKQEKEEEGQDSTELQRINEYLVLLEQQRDAPEENRRWCAYHELVETTTHFDLILDVNEPEARQKPLSETTRLFGQLLGHQQPVGGMAGQINNRLVRQFRMPGYPFALVTTDLLQEGEDLHTFCASVHHYGISWTPSSMEQRVGRIDRVRSLTDRRLSALKTTMTDEDKLQVYLPHLQDTVEVFQVRRVLERMNTFLRLMHEGLILPRDEGSRINLEREVAAGQREVPPVQGLLKSAFSCERHLGGEHLNLEVGPDYVEDAQRRFLRLRDAHLEGLRIDWEPTVSSGRLLGTAKLGRRIQPFTLLLKSIAGRLLVRCISPVGRVSPEDNLETIQSTVAQKFVRIGAIRTAEDKTYDLTVEEDVLLGVSDTDDFIRIAALIRRVVEQADLQEQAYLPGLDEALNTFASQLGQEGRNES